MRVTSRPTLRAVSPCAVTHSSWQLPSRAAPQSGPTLSEASDRFTHQTLSRGVSAPVRIRPWPPKGPRSIPLGSAADPPPGVSPPASRRPVRHRQVAPRGNRFRPSEGPPSNRDPTRGSVLKPSRAEPPECRAPWLPSSPRLASRHGLPCSDTTRRSRSPGPREPRVGCDRLPRWQSRNRSASAGLATCIERLPCPSGPKAAKLRTLRPATRGSLGSGALPGCLAASGSGLSDPLSIGECPSRCG